MLVSFVIITTTLTGLTGSPLSGIEGASADFLSPFTTSEGRPLTIVFLLSVAGMVIRRIRRPKDITAIHGGRERGPDQRESQHVHDLACGSLRTRCNGRNARSSRRYPIWECWRKSPTPSASI